MAKQMQVRAAAAGPTAHRGHATGLDAPSARKPSLPMVQRHRYARTLPPSSDPRRLASARQQPEWLQAVTTARRPLSPAQSPRALLVPSPRPLLQQRATDARLAHRQEAVLGKARAP